MRSLIPFLSVDSAFFPPNFLGHKVVVVGRFLDGNNGPGEKNEKRRTFTLIHPAGTI